MSDSKTTGNVVDGFGGRLQTDETGVELQAPPGKDVNILTTGGGQLKANGTPVGGGGVTSFDGRTGAVVPTSGDYTYAQITGTPTFVDAETPTTFNTNSDYDLAHAPNPLASLQVFINSEAVPKAGCDRLLVQGVDYSLTTGTHGANTRIHYLVTPTATNTIRAWYRM